MLPWLSLSTTRCEACHGLRAIDTADKHTAAPLPLDIMQPGLHTDLMLRFAAMLGRQQT